MFIRSLFNPTRKELLANRQKKQIQINAGQLPDFLASTKAIRDDPSWKAAPPAPGLVNRKVEITGPVDRKMVINALNCGANTFMVLFPFLLTRHKQKRQKADFEDSNAPTWLNNISGQSNLKDAVRGTITYTAPNGKFYKLREDGKVATLLVRPRGWHMEEAHFTVRLLHLPIIFDRVRLTANLFLLPSLTLDSISSTTPNN